MPERHHWSLKPYTGSEPCQKWGCLVPATVEARYRFQHDGEARATLRTWPYCARHGRGWAQAKGLAFADVAPLVSEPPIAMDDGVVLTGSDLRGRPRFHIDLFHRLGLRRSR